MTTNINTKRRQETIKALSNIAEGFEQLLDLYGDYDDDLEYINDLADSYNFDNALEDLEVQAFKFKRQFKELSRKRELLETLKKELNI